jgi:hypothetical protein
VRGKDVYLCCGRGSGCQTPKDLATDLETPSPIAENTWHNQGIQFQVIKKARSDEGVHFWRSWHIILVVQKSTRNHRFPDITIKFG